GASTYSLPAPGRSRRVRRAESTAQGLWTTIRMHVAANAIALALRLFVDRFVVARLEGLDDRVDAARAGAALRAFQPEDPAIPPGSAEPVAALLRLRARVDRGTQVRRCRERLLHRVGAVPFAARLRGLDGGEAHRAHLARGDQPQRDLLVHLRPLAPPPTRR